MEQPKMGGQAVTRLFIKGNDDLTTALFSKTDGGASLDLGIKEQIEATYDGRFSIEAIQEPAARIEMMHQQLNGTSLPNSIKEQGLAQAVAFQFNSQIFTEDSDILIFSIQPDLTVDLWRHQDDGSLICPPTHWEADWTQEQISWFSQNYSPVSQPTGVEYKELLTNLVQSLKDKTSAHIVMFGCCSYDSAPEPHNFSHQKDTLTIQTNRFNLAMLEVSFSEGISFIDVDRILAEIGCAHNVVKRFHYSEVAYEAIRDEFVRVITDVGFFEQRPLLVQMGHRSR